MFEKLIDDKILEVFELQEDDYNVLSKIAQEWSDVRFDYDLEDYKLDPEYMLCMKDKYRDWLDEIPENLDDEYFLGSVDGFYEYFILSNGSHCYFVDSMYDHGYMDLIDQYSEEELLEFCEAMIKAKRKH